MENPKGYVVAKMSDDGENFEKLFSCNSYEQAENKIEELEDTGKYNHAWLEILVDWGDGKLSYF